MDAATRSLPCAPAAESLPRPTRTPCAI